MEHWTHNQSRAYLVISIVSPFQANVEGQHDRGKYGRVRNVKRLRTLEEALGKLRKADMLGHKSTQILFDVYEKFIPRRTRLDGSALIARMREESGGKNEPMSAPQYDPNTTVSPSTQSTGSVSQ